MLICNNKTTNYSKKGEHKFFISIQTQKYSSSFSYSFVKGQLTREEEEKIVLRAAETSGCYFCGVDTIVNDGKIYVLEVNGSPGTGDSNEISYMNYYGDKKSRINGSKMVDNLLDYISDKDNWAFPKTSVGRIEWVKIEGLKFKAKLDTGNSAGGISLHATDIKEKGKKVSFKFGGKTFNKKIEDTKMIYFGGKNSNSIF